MTKRKIAVFGILILCFLAISMLLKGQTYVIELPEDSIGSIVVRSGGEIREYSDRNDIYDILSHFDGVVLKRGNKIDHRENGSLCSVDFFSADGSEKVFRVIIKDWDCIQITAQDLEFPFDAREVVALFAQ